VIEANIAITGVQPKLSLVVGRKKQKYFVLLLSIIKAILLSSRQARFIHPYLKMKIYACI